MKSAIWFTDNLRVADHPLLSEACASQNELVAFFCYDPTLFDQSPKGLAKIGSFRKKFLVESLSELAESLKELNIPLHILIGKPAEKIPSFIAKHSVTSLYTQKIWHEEESNRNRGVFNELNVNTRLIQAYDQFLLDPSQWPFTIETLPKVFTVFRNKIESNLQIPRPLEVPNAPANNPQLSKAPTTKEWEDIKTEALQITTDTRTAFPFKGGEQQALARIKDYFWNTDHVAVYKNTRNGLLGTEYSTKFSAWLANGSISPRTIYWELKAYENERTKNESTYWVFFELLWREFFKCVGLKHRTLLFKSGGILNKEFAVGNDPDILKKWKNGETSNNFINANMKELAASGWMSNRGRQNVASYWSKTLGQDWRLGASYFESMLIDYDVDSNWGNWMYASGVGNDPRDRIFDPSRQAKMYDASGSFQRKWLQNKLF